jgi:hypothetical protein
MFAQLIVFFFHLPMYHFLHTSHANSDLPRLAYITRVNAAFVPTTNTFKDRANFGHLL